MTPIPKWATHIDSEGNFWANKDYRRPVTSDDFLWEAITRPFDWSRDDSTQPYIKYVALQGTEMLGTCGSLDSPRYNWRRLYHVADHALLLALEGRTYKRTGMYTMEEIE
jgi:hypothetical protein